MQIPYFIYAQFLALLAAIIFYRGLKNYNAASILLIILLSFGTETTNRILKSMGHTNNHFLYNLFLISSAPLYFYLYYKLLHLSGRLKKMYVGIALFVSVLFLLNFFFFEGMFVFNTLSIILYQFFTTLLSVFLLFKLAISEQYFRLSRHPYFWMAAGLLIFSLGTLVVLGMNQYIRIHRVTIVNKALYQTIMPVLNLILYLSYTYAFYLCAQTKKLYSPL